LHSPFTVVARTAGLSKILQRTMVDPSTDDHVIVSEISLLAGTLRQITVAKIAMQ
jgi:hypothetical protein